MNTQKISQKVSFSFFPSILILIFIFNFFVATNKVEAASCPDDWNYTPQIEVNIASNTFYSDSGGSVDLPYGVSIPFTVGSHNHPPSSIITITYPYGSVETYPSQSDGVFRSLEIPAINEAVNGERSLNVSLNPNCTYAVGLPQQGEPAPTVNLNIPIYVTAPSTCTISSFSADNELNVPYNTGTTLRFSFGGGSFSWAISLLTGSVNSTPTSGVGSSGTASTNNLTATQTYRLSCNGGQATRDLTVSVQPPPTLTAYWDENSSATLNKTVAPGQSYSIPFTFKKVGSGSLRFSKCSFVPPSGGEGVEVVCPTPVGTEISN